MIRIISKISIALNIAIITILDSEMLAIKAIARAIRIIMITKLPIPMNKGHFITKLSAVMSKLASVYIMPIRMTKSILSSGFTLSFVVQIIAKMIVKITFAIPVHMSRGLKSANQNR